MKNDEFIKPNATFSNEYDLFREVMNIHSTDGMLDGFDMDFTNSYLSTIKANFIIQNMKIIVAMRDLFTMSKNLDEKSRKEIYKIGLQPVNLLYQDVKGELHLSKSVNGNLMNSILKAEEIAKENDKSFKDFMVNTEKNES